LYAYNSKPDLEVFDFALQHCYSLKSPIKIVERFFQSRHIQVLLNRLDMISMRSGVEARVPFLDHNLIELVHLSNVEDRLNNQQSKISLRKVAKNYMPDSVANQTKVGFPFNLEGLFAKSDGKVGPTSVKDSYQKWLDWSYSEFSSAAKT
jgi:asparagine synthetase B (glutamine-hydrolysing)